MGVLDRYTLWNYMLAEQCLLADSYNGAVLLTVTPRLLSAALNEAGEGAYSLQDAESDFTNVVGAFYRERVLTSPRKLLALSSNGDDVPLSLGFLALTVLAAYHMRTDDEHTGRAYYPRLAEMLGVDISRTLPLGFDGDSFIRLWEELGKWLDGYNRVLASPSGTGVRRYVAFPLAHVPLRQVDIERLPSFFETHGYEPGARAPLDRLSYDLHDGSGPWRYFTTAGKQALRDAARRPFVVRQVAHELERWDGCRTDSSGRRIATIEIWMDIRRRRAHLALLARRPPGFPELIEEEDFVFESSQDGWYDPVPIGPADAGILDSGLKITTRHGSDSFVVQIRHSAAIPLTPSEEYTAFVSDRVLRADTRCAVLCHQSVEHEVSRYLAKVSTSSPVARHDETLPQGWCLYTDVYPTGSASPSPDFERLRVESSVALVPTGGLRLGRKWSWLRGAPARLKVVGAYRGQVTTIDGHTVEVDDEGGLPTSLLRDPGTHVVEIGNSLRQRITVLPGAVHPRCRSWSLDVVEIPLVIPGGRWSLLGKRPGDVATYTAPPSGACVRPPFSVNWAIRVGAGPGAVVLHIHDARIIQPGGSAEPTQRRPDCRRIWADTTYQAMVRRPRLLCEIGCPQEDITSSWRRFSKAARRFKRELKGRRR